MADFTALKSAIQTYIKQNGNEEITGEKLQEILLSVVTTLGDSAINDLVTALANEVAARQNADGTLQQNITNEATARGNADTALGGRIDDEVTARANGDTALSNRLGSTITAENTAADQIGAEAEARAAADTALQGLIDGITDNIENGYVYAGIATPSSTPATGKVFYLALTAGTYTNFGNTEVSQGINILKYNGSAWSLDAFIGIDDTPTPNSPNLVKSGGVQNELALGAVYDVSAKNPTAGPNNDGKWESLSALLSDANLNTLIPTAVRKGGMSIKFVHTSDNKYVQCRYMSSSTAVADFTNVANWQGVDDEPIAGSNNLVKSGGVAELQQYAYFNLNFIGEGNVQNKFIRRLYLKPDKVYRLTLSKTDWLVNSISAENAIFSYGRYDGNGQTVAIAWFTPAQQSEIPATIILNENNYSDATGFYVAFRGDVGEKVSLSIEDITEKYLYNKISVTRNQELTTDSSFLNYTELLKNDLNVCCLIKSESLSVITVGYYIKGSSDAIVVVDHSDKIGEIISFTIPQGTELRGLALYASTSAVVSDGEVEYCFILDNSLTLPIFSIKNEIAALEYKIRKATAFTKNISTVANTEISGADATLSVDIKKGSVYSIVIVDPSRSLYYASTGNYLFAVNYSDGTKLNAQPFIPNVLEYKIAEKDVISISLWVRNTAVVASGTISLKVLDLPNMSSIDYNSIVRDNFNSLSILGNSWSTYYKWIPSANASWYAFDGVDGHNARVGEETLNHVDSVTQTWWWMLSNETKTKLLVNESYSGSAIGGGHAQSISFVPRMKRSIGEDRALSPKPDLIFIEGGTNDAYLDDVPVGDLKYSDWTDSDLNNTIPAFCYILDCLKKWNPGAVIVNLVNQTLLSASESSVRTKGEEIMNKMRTACTHYGVYNYEMAFINKENNHPSQNGMTQIKEQVKGFLNAVLTGNIGI